MKIMTVVLVLCGYALTSKMAHADVSQLTTLMQRNNCLACHMIDKRKYGPNMKEVATKYNGKEGAVDFLSNKIKAGGTGVWGQDIMPPQPQVSEENAKLMAQLILLLETK